MTIERIRYEAFDFNTNTKPDVQRLARLAKDSTPSFPQLVHASAPGGLAYLQQHAGGKMPTLLETRDYINYGQTGLDPNAHGDSKFRMPLVPPMAKITAPRMQPGVLAQRM